MRPLMLGLVPLFFLVLASLLCGAASSQQDFYQLLGIARDASTRELRRAFKKLALEKHPDKNPHNPQAHVEFVAINQAFEVLKDPETRRIYDRFGEQGLKDRQEQEQQQQRYESYQFYQEEFGLYDNDPQVDTLTVHDFDHAIHSAKVVFVNFYSPVIAMISPPHGASWPQLYMGLPLWLLSTARKIGIFASTGGFKPCLLFYFSKMARRVVCTRDDNPFSGHPTPYRGLRDLEALQSAVIAALPSVSPLPALAVSARGLDWSHLKDTPTANAPYLVIVICAPREPCLSEDDLVLLQAMVHDFAALQVLSCLRPLPIAEPSLADFGTDRLTLFDAPSPKTATQRLGIAVARALHRLGPVTRVACDNVCQRLHHVHELPALRVYTPVGHETYFGAPDSESIVAWTKQARAAPVEQLHASDFPGRVMQGTQARLVDFYAHWCQPCQQLAPFFREAAATSSFADVRFATVNCAVEVQLCRDLNVHSYPTLVYYPGGNAEPILFHGDLFSTRGLLTFLQQTLDPSTVTLTTATFHKQVFANDDQIWVIDFMSSRCGPCLHFKPEFERAAFQLRGLVKFATIDCISEAHLCMQERIHQYPTVRICQADQWGKKRCSIYQGFLHADHLLATVRRHFPSQTKDITGPRLRKEIATGAKVWLVAFATPWCGPCQQFKPALNELAYRASRNATDLQVGAIDCQRFERACRLQQVPHYPFLILYRGQGVQPLRMDAASPEEIWSRLEEAVPEVFKAPNSFHDEL
ncbi:uncharacterized protein MONBRDRAFT_21911 [Monosiga brevicollis MX1]|uniref:DnaJ homolog subfamily C member 16 n=1 Tax=Monosiga brevicollis TaxID=81824 RepID=A9UNZ4_MONBE|nr:uncharacterized protein MONBRDRAFT_21911 [Monosiga brevicollis MX1]EDQ92785.1 predicted protein [Monosiga brevicollis MX1]|eukprot:XP_001742547.1 hypothetical protein [Monosiga brevicollis MX1]